MQDTVDDAPLSSDYLEIGGTNIPIKSAILGIPFEKFCSSSNANETMKQLLNIIIDKERTLDDRKTACSYFSRLVEKCLSI